MQLGRLFDDQNVPPESPLYWALGAFFVALLIGSLYVYLQAGRRYADDRFHLRLVRRHAAIVAGFSGLGVAAVAFSFLAVPFLSKRLWLALALAGLAASGGYIMFYLRRRYRTALRRHEEHARRQRYLPRRNESGRKRRGRRR